MDYIERSVVVKKVMETKWESGSDGAVAMEIVAATPAADGCGHDRYQDAIYGRTYTLQKA